MSGFGAYLFSVGAAARPAGVSNRAKQVRDASRPATFTSMGRLRGARAMHPTQQHAVERELNKACRRLDRNPGRDRWHAVLRRLSKRLVAHEDAADEPGEEHRMADRTPGPRQLRVQIRHDAALDQHSQNAKGEDGLRPMKKRTIAERRSAYPLNATLE